MLVPKNVQYCTLNSERRTLRILNPVTPSLFMNVCMKIFLKAWNHIMSFDFPFVRLFGVR